MFRLLWEVEWAPVIQCEYRKEDELTEVVLLDHVVVAVVIVGIRRHWLSIPLAALSPI